MAWPAALQIQPKIAISRSSSPVPTIVERCACSCLLTSNENCFFSRKPSDSNCCAGNVNYQVAPGEFVGDVVSSSTRQASNWAKCASLASSDYPRTTQNGAAKTIEAETGDMKMNEQMFVSWFRMAWPYIQGHRSSVFVVVLPGDVIADSSKIDGVFQDLLLLHGLGIKLVIIPGSQVQIDQLLVARGCKPLYEGAYRITDENALAASMEAAGSIRVAIEAKLSRGPSIPILRRDRDNQQWHEVSIASGNYLAAKRRGVVDGVDFGATGEVKRIDIGKIRERLDKNCIVMLSNLGYSSTGEVLNCNTYEVATACAIALQADKLLVLLDGPILDENGRHLRFMTLNEADKLIRKRASQSYTAADYVKAVAGPAYVQSLGIPTGKTNGCATNGATNGKSVPSNGRSLDGATKDRENSSEKVSGMTQHTGGAGFAIGGEERLSRAYGYLSELTAAVYVCRNGVGRVQLLDSNVEGALLLELYTRDGVGTMVSSDYYEGTRPATRADIQSIIQLLRPLEESGILVNRPRKQLEKEVKNYFVVERDGSIIACAALIPFRDDKCGELASFAVSPECQGMGLGNTLLGFVEKKAEEMKLERLFLLTTRTADWFLQRGFFECTVEWVPEIRKGNINFARGSKYYTKYLNQPIGYKTLER
ncbi:unnamed protein product [Calypogeia fissa]